MSVELFIFINSKHIKSSIFTFMSLKVLHKLRILNRCACVRTCVYIYIKQVKILKYLKLNQSKTLYMKRTSPKLIGLKMNVLLFGQNLPQ